MEFLLGLGVTAIVLLGVAVLACSAEDRHVLFGRPR
jgi:hypothetical protein